MPSPRHRSRRPYTKVLSALLKTDLVRLCVEFRLRTDGSVVDLRNRLKDYLNLHRDTLFANARYKPLFPRHRRPDQPPPPPPGPLPLSNTLSSRHSSPALSYVSSPRSYASWHGIEDLPQPELHQDEPAPFQQPLDIPDQIIPSPPPSVYFPDHASPPPVPPLDGRKLSLPLPLRAIALMIFASLGVTPICRRLRSLRRVAFSPSLYDKTLCSLCIPRHYVVSSFFSSRHYAVFDWTL